MILYIERVIIRNTEIPMQGIKKKQAGKGNAADGPGGLSVSGRASREFHSRAAEALEAVVCKVYRKEDG